MFRSAVSTPISDNYVSLQVHAFACPCFPTHPVVVARYRLHKSGRAGEELSGNGIVPLPPNENFLSVDSVCQRQAKFAPQTVDKLQKCFVSDTLLLIILHNIINNRLLSEKQLTNFPIYVIVSMTKHVADAE